eukprot:CAMPEP_0174363020 /NCGR_PEP_ID=MMETSP0811_2-20130205/67009_1 /TAXON_ID=73025 ORGANISM="Eutreptiella gymnastica-like, Strain CCMP1594" /NCGR_SAMPLE_ID=MMETSP0811_2 /ASSEMBLY_ACC=CAM_ASM_000667 /LENGTH=74 /DNA_ID=CAMNT_0015501281 /DNA_START=20 /DNA_END=244 /DNA_ORIENTATION=+
MGYSTVMFTNQWVEGSQAAPAAGGDQTPPRAACSRAGALYSEISQIDGSRRHGSCPRCTGSGKRDMGCPEAIKL